MKPSAERLRLSTYPFTTEIEPRFGDMDSLHHLNNVALAGMGQAEARELAAALAALDRSPDLAPLLRALRRPQARTPLSRH